MSDKIKVGVVGATGYAGLELCRLILTHPQAELAAVSSVSFEGQQLADVYPSLYQRLSMVLRDADEVIAESDVVFGSVPHGVSEEYAEKCLAAGAVFIDLGADFRLSDPADYEKWYGKKYNRPELHEKSCYALPELNRARIRECDILGNPGCYPTSIALGLYPALKNGMVRTHGIVIDSKSGATGAGRGLSQTTHFADLNEGFSPYKVAAHRHLPEIEETLSRMAESQVTVTFVPHLLPINRGILSTIYARLDMPLALEDVHAVYEKFYEKERFVRVLPLGKTANLKHVKYSNYCDISLHMDGHNNTLIIASCIDNMVKGSAGQAVQNMNIRFGLDEAEGLDLVPPAF